jgi:hypothetical protein
MFQGRLRRLSHERTNLIELRMRGRCLGVGGRSGTTASFKPFVLIGGFHGRIESADASATVDAVAKLTRQNAELAARPPAIAQMETEAFRVQQQAIADSLGVQSGVADMADLACVIGTIIPRGATVMP